jgi:hypothetical protein
VTENIVNVSRCMKIREVLKSVRPEARRVVWPASVMAVEGKALALPESKVSHCRFFFPPPNVCRLPASYSCDGDRQNDRPRQDRIAIRKSAVLKFAVLKAFHTGNCRPQYRNVTRESEPA